MATRRGLVASFFVSLIPGSGDAKRREKTQPAISYTATIVDEKTNWTEVPTLVAAYAQGLAPYGVTTSYELRMPAPCAEDVTICDNPIPREPGVVADGGGEWSWDGQWELDGTLRVFRNIDDSLKRSFIICHELGHVFGLSHVPAGTDSCMQDDLSSAVLRSGPSQSDIDTIVSLLPVTIPESPKRHKKRKKQS